MVMAMWRISVSVTDTGRSTRKNAMDRARLGNRFTLKPLPVTARTMRRTSASLCVSDNSAASSLNRSGMGSSRLASKSTSSGIITMTE